MPIKLSRLLRSPRWYQRSLQLLFDELEMQDEINLNQEIFLKSQNQTIILDRKILKKSFTRDQPGSNIELIDVRFDVASENDSNDPSWGFQAPIINTEQTIYKKNSRIFVKKKRRLTHTLTNEAHIAQHQSSTNLLYPFTHYFTTERRYNTLKPDTFDEQEIITKRFFHTQITKPRGRLLSEMKQSNDLSRLPFNEILRLFVGIIDEIETLEMMGISNLSLKPNNISYERETQQITILNYAATKENNQTALGILLAQLMGVPLLKIQLAQTHSAFSQEITDEIKHNKKTVSKELIEQVTQTITNLLEPHPEKNTSFTEIKSEMLGILNKQNVSAPPQVQESFIKESFFKAAINPNAPNLMIPLYAKLQAAFNLPWNKASRFVGVPGSIKKMRRILSQPNLSEKDKLQQIQKFCATAVSLPKWKKVLRGRRNITHDLINLLQRIDELPMHQMINQLDLFITKFNQTMKIDAGKASKASPLLPQMHQ